MQGTDVPDNFAESDDRNNADGASQIHSIHTLLLEKPPCCIEFSPLARDYFIVGTYNLVDDSNKDTNNVTETRTQPQQRDGSLILCRIAEDEM